MHLPMTFIGLRQSLDCLAGGGKLGPFRSLFPVRYYINDFEFADTFEPNSEPSSRTVTGLPATVIRSGEYARKLHRNADWGSLLPVSR